MKQQDNLSKMFYKDTIKGQDKATIKGSPEVDSGDPRIDSPEIEVIYPSGTGSIDSTKQEPDTTENKPENLEVPPVPKPEVVKVEVTPENVIHRDIATRSKEDHVCKMNLLDAAKEHWVAVTIFGVLAIGTGFLLGGSKFKANDV